MNSVLKQMAPIGLDDMKAVRLMNRVDQKYMASICQLEELLEGVQRRLYGSISTPLNLQMFPDRDEPGEELFHQLQSLYPQIVRHQLPSDCKDFSDYYIKLKHGNSN
jgi:hypothetical protein